MISSAFFVFSHAKSMWIPASICQPTTFAPNVCTNIKSVDDLAPDLTSSKQIFIKERRIPDFGLF